MIEPETQITLPHSSTQKRELISGGNVFT